MPGLSASRTIRGRPWPLHRGHLTSRSTVWIEASGGRGFILRSTSVAPSQLSHTIVSQGCFAVTAAETVGHAHIARPCSSRALKACTEAASVRLLPGNFSVGVNGPGCLVPALLAGKALQFVFFAQLRMRRPTRQHHLAMAELACENVVRAKIARFLNYQVHLSTRQPSRREHISVSQPPTPNGTASMMPLS